MNNNRTTFGLDTFWETCDRDGIGENPLERELCFRLDAQQRYRQQIEDAESIGDDEAVALLSKHHENTRDIIKRLRAAIARQNSGNHMGSSRDQTRHENPNLSVVAGRATGRPAGDPAPGAG